MSMDRASRDNAIDDLREMQTKLDIWIRAEDLDPVDRKELNTARVLLGNVMGRLMGDNRIESDPFRH